MPQPPERYGTASKRICEVFPDKARVSASVADEQIRSGRYRGPLHGIPLGLKDNIAVSGWVTGAGSSFLKKRADRHAAVTTNLIDAGAVLVGRLNMDEFGCGISGNSEFGICEESLESGSDHVWIQ